MDRMYRRAIKGLKEAQLQEIADDIDQYVNYLRLSNSVLVHELSRQDSFAGNQLLKSMGFTIKDKDGVREKCKHDYIPDACDNPEHDYCVMCDRRRVSIEKGD